MPAKKLTSDDYRARMIRAVIASKGMTQRQLANKLHVEESVLSRRINHVENMRVCDLKQLCKALNLNIMDVLEVKK